eukprot:scaffold187257_cov35-Tisochrysis_lutea.AAC.4
MSAGPLGGWSIFKAGIMPTKPADRGIVAVATPTVWRTTFSCALSTCAEAGQKRNIAKPTTAHCMLPIVTQPVCRPKYMLVKQSTVPIANPPRHARIVSCGGPSGWSRRSSLLTAMPSNDCTPVSRDSCGSASRSSVPQRTIPAGRSGSISIGACLHHAGAEGVASRHSRAPAGRRGRL